MHVWAGAWASNAKNCVEMKHGIPFWRLARFAFFAEPGPRDLACILNANAAYTFCCGLLQLVFGGGMLFYPLIPGVPPAEAPAFGMNSILPLGISFCSLLLTLANIFLDFASILSELDEEKRLYDKIKTSCDSEQERKKTTLNQRREERINQLDMLFPIATSMQLTNGQKFEKKQLSDKINEDFQLGLMDLNAETTERLRIELSGYRVKLKTVKAIMAGKNEDIEPDFSSAGEVERLQKLSSMYSQKIDELERKYAAEISAMDMASMGADEFREMVETLMKDKNAKVSIFKWQQQALMGAAP